MLRFSISPPRPFSAFPSSPFTFFSFFGSAICFLASSFWISSRLLTLAPSVAGLLTPAKGAPPQPVLACSRANSAAMRRIGRRGKTSHRTAISERKTSICRCDGSFPTGSRGPFSLHLYFFEECVSLMYVKNASECGVWEAPIVFPPNSFDTKHR